MEKKNTTLDDIAALIGFTKTLRLSAWYGNGNNLFVPDSVEPGQVLVKLIGMESALQLTKHYGGTHMAVPRLASYEEDVRRQRIGSLLELGMSTRKVSQYERISERRVQQVCRELELAGLIAPIGSARPKVPVEKPQSFALQENWPPSSAGKNAKRKPPAKSPLGKTSGKNAK